MEVVIALAYFITFTVYGTRLHGSAKGSVDKAHNVYGTPVLEADAKREAHERAAYEPRKEPRTK